MNDELYICIPQNKVLRIAHMADIHFGIEGKDWHNDKVLRTKKYIEYIVKTENPDLIVCSGDNILATGTTGLKEFIDFMDTFKTPWMFVYGNHDAESWQKGFMKVDLNEYLKKSNSKYLIYNEGYVEYGCENRYGNYTVNIYNENKTKLLGAIIIFDSGTYDYDERKYQAITKGQINWYEAQIDRLQDVYEKQSNNQYEVIPTIVFAHIQLPEFYEAYNKAIENNGASFVIKQVLLENEIEDIRTGAPYCDAGLFDVMTRKRSTKAYLVGHAHTLLYQVEMDGIVLGFGPQTGFSKLFVNNDDPRKTYIYDLNEDFTFKTHISDELV